eukprot:3316605-Amphidinium_carterae.1
MEGEAAFQMASVSLLYASCDSQWASFLVGGLPVRPSGTDLSMLEGPSSIEPVHTWQSRIGSLQRGLGRVH